MKLNELCSQSELQRSTENTCSEKYDDKPFHCEYLQPEWTPVSPWQTELEFVANDSASHPCHTTLYYHLRRLYINGQITFPSSNTYVVYYTQTTRKRHCLTGVTAKSLVHSCTRIL